MAGHDLEILVPRAAISVLVLDPRVRKPDVPIVVRQLVFTRPTRNLFRLTVRPAVAVLVASVALVQEALIVALQLVVEDDAPNPTALAADTLGALVGPIHLVSCVSSRGFLMPAWNVWRGSWVRSLRS